MRWSLLPVALPLLALAACASGVTGLRSTAQAGPQPEWRQSVEVPVLVRVSVFEPEVIRLEAGRPTRMVFYNPSQASLSLQAASFFRSAQIRSGDAELVADGGMVLRPGESKQVVLVPSEGRYRMRSRSWLRRLIGMSALIIVERPSEG